VPVFKFSLRGNLQGGYLQGVIWWNAFCQARCLEGFTTGGLS